MMDKKSKEITAFIVDNNLFEWNRFAFGLTNAPGIFQRLMNNVMSEDEGDSKTIVEANSGEEEVKNPVGQN